MQAGRHHHPTKRESDLASAAPHRKIKRGVCLPVVSGSLAISRGPDAEKHSVSSAVFREHQKNKLRYA